jgi:hypothetical protein
MYNAIIPSYSTNKSNGKTGDETVNASDPKNKDKVHKIMFG